jgi:hypothetical protein
MLLIVSTLALRLDESWFLQQVAAMIPTGADVAVMGISSADAHPLKERGCAVHHLSFEWDVGRIVSRRNVFGPIFGEETDSRWALNLCCLRLQSEECVLQSLKMVRRLREFWRCLLADLKPSAILLSNPAVLHTGILREEAEKAQIPYVAFERGPIKGTFEVDLAGVGPNGVLTGEATSAVRRSLAMQAIEDGKWQRRVEASNSRPAEGSFCVGPNQLPANGAVIGVFGVDDTTTGNIFGNSTFLRWGGTSWGFAVQLAEATDKHVAFKPHPSSIHLVGTTTIPRNLSIVMGALDDFVANCSHIVGLGSTADIAAILSKKRYCLCGASVFSSTGLVDEASSMADLLTWLERNSELEVKQEGIQSFLQEVCRKFLVTPEEIPEHCKSILKTLDAGTSQTPAAARREALAHYAGRREAFTHYGDRRPLLRRAIGTISGKIRRLLGR